MAVDPSAHTPDIHIVPADPARAEAALAFGRAVAGETAFLHRLPSERAPDAAAMETVLCQFAEAPNCLLLHAWHGDCIVGEAGLQGGALVRTRHVASLGMAVRRTHWGRGIAGALIAGLEDFARDAGILRIELSVMAHNARARALYRRLGYVEEGVLRWAARIDGTLIDEVAMAKLLAPVCDKEGRG